MLHVSTKNNLVCHTSVNVKFNGVLDFAGSQNSRVGHFLAI